MKKFVRSGIYPNEKLIRVSFVDTIYICKFCLVPLHHTEKTLLLLLYIIYYYISITNKLVKNSRIMMEIIAQ